MFESVAVDGKDTISIAPMILHGNTLYDQFGKYNGKECKGIQLCTTDYPNSVRIGTHFSGFELPLSEETLDKWTTVSTSRYNIRCKITKGWF